MTIKASAVTPAKAIELAPGALFVIKQEWYLRVQLTGHYEPIVESAIQLGGGTEVFDPSGERCITLAPNHSFEVRLIGAIDGPGAPPHGAPNGPRWVPHGSLTWTVGGKLVIAWEKLYLTLDGLESNEVNPHDAFYVTHWGVWGLDPDGKQISPEPLVVIGAHA
ncbi:hypothetical protein QYZ29_21550 [Xanthomonas campestris pv. campestris]|uniref:hypothetical protein n=1 Tax=Xanthomonas campestris TaxID=339 RepID=UPI000838F115|nr:hypothetical protein [Xanthomonas campestris]MCF8838429.1 hypothetical protein [Xanthomonas campestris pv. campestris]MCF8865809.1 hypothetical protein [Xanthomonas campestris pv. campestris]MDO0882920.1 hypothetical protein [Xanthomonas campestris pv. campestris]MEA0635186.1 hypothetical protein [Xanthomonas campestris pv. campestris]MEA0651579.1 hypothetical protein [Xanthomonas campestris pv. campestris]